MPSQITTDDALTIQGLLNKMSAEHMLTFLSNHLLIKADDSAQDGRFGDEKHYMNQCFIIESAISRLRELERHYAVL